MRHRRTNHCGYNFYYAVPNGNITIHFSGIASTDTCLPRKILVCDGRSHNITPRNTDGTTDMFFTGSNPRCTTATSCTNRSPAYRNVADFTRITSTRTPRTYSCTQTTSTCDNGSARNCNISRPSSNTRIVAIACSKNITSLYRDITTFCIARSADTGTVL